MVKKYFVLIIVIFLVNSVSAADYYVNNAASGSNSGTSWANAWESFADINWGSIQPGDTVYISGGTTSKTYNEQLTIGASGTSGNPITIQVGQNSPHNGQVIIDAQDSRQYCIDPDSNIVISGSGSTTTYGILCRGSTNDGIHGTSGTNNVKIEYVEVYDAGNSPSGDCIQVGDSSGWEISHCYIHQCFQDGVNSGGGSATDWGENSIHHSTILHVCDDGFQAGTGWDIYNNEIGFATMDLDVNPHCSGAAGHPDGIQIQRMYYRVYNNIIHDSATYNLWVSSTQGTAGDGHIRYLNNIVYMTDHENYGTTSGGIGYASSGSGPWVTDVIIAHNTIIDTGGTSAGDGLFVWAGESTPVTDYYVYNNIIYNCGVNGRAFQDSSVSDNGGIIDYNIIATDGSHGTTTIHYNGARVSYEDWVSQSGQNIHGSNNAPVFNHYSWLGSKVAEDLQLASSDNAAINRGTLVTGSNFPTGWPFDYLGNSRPQGSGWDIGAYEYGGTPPPTCTGYCCPSGYTCSSPISGSCSSGQCCTSQSYCTQAPSCGDGTCDSGETCSSCPADCQTGSGQVCCSGTIYTGNCCSDNECNSGYYCSNSHECTLQTQTCSQLGGVDCCTGSETCGGTSYSGSSDCSGICCSQTCTQGGTQDEIIIDNIDSGFTSSAGSDPRGWWGSSYPNPYATNSLGSNLNLDSTATWTPLISQAGNYEVYAWWTSGDGRINDAKYTINYAGGSDLVIVDQKTNGGQWNYLGIYNFNSGTSGSVSVSDESTDPNYVPGSISDSVCADAVRFLMTEGTVCGESDGDGDGVVSIGELINYIGEWKVGNVNIGELIGAIGKWKSGC